MKQGANVVWTQPRCGKRGVWRVRSGQERSPSGLSPSRCGCSRPRRRRSFASTSSTAVTRDKQHLACIRVVDNALVLETMYYADEIRLPEEVPKPKVSAAEVDMAKTLIENLAAPWDPKRYHDRYRSELQKLLERKAE